MLCNAGTISGGVERECASFSMPDGAGAETNVNCNDYKIAVTCDLFARPYKLALSITGPDGASVTTSTKSEIKTVAMNGEGAFVRCSVH
jgi:hypothetical protein